RYFPGNVRVVLDQPVDSIIVRRTDLEAALAGGTGLDTLVAWLAERGRRTVYTPDTSIAAPPPPVLRPHLAATYAHAKARGIAARRARGASVSAATTLSLIPAACALAGVVLVAVGAGATRTGGIALVAAYGAAVVASAVLAALRFRSARVGLLAAPTLVATQGAYVAGFLHGFAGRG